MDPNACLEQIIIAATESEPEILIRHAEDLAEWLRRGGFPPEHEGER